MNNDDASMNEFWRFIERASNDPISADDARAFAARLANDPEAQRTYLEHIQLQADIRLHVRSRESLEKALVRLDDELSANSDVVVRSMNGSPELNPANELNTISAASIAPRMRHLRTSSHKQSSRVMALAVGIAAAATVLIVSADLLNWNAENKSVVKVERPVAPTVATPPAPPSNTAQAPSPKPNPTAPDFIARIVQKSEDLVWSESNDSFDFLLRIKPRQQIKIESGFVQVDFYSGGKFILHGPAVFTPLGRASGRLESGKITGQVNRGHFRLKTPTAEVFDLGTAFGVSTSKEVGTDVLVFDGRVQVHSEPRANGEKSVLDMTEGMAARFRADGTMDSALKPDAAQFARSIPGTASADHPDEISLVDIIAGGSGRESYLAGSIAPFNGERDFGTEGNAWKHMAHPSDGVVHPAIDCPMVDSVFVPKADGRQMPIDSAGHKVDLPANGGYAFGTLWARRKESIANLRSEPDFDFWGFRTLEGIVAKLKTVRSGLVGIHANMGVTFDLQRMQAIHKRSPLEFRCSVANIENFADWPPEEAPANPETRFADCRVYVDGNLRFSRIGFRREDGDQSFAVPLTSEDRFLTVVITDGDGDLRYDHVVLIDPMIALQKQ